MVWGGVCGCVTEDEGEGRGGGRVEGGWLEGGGCERRRGRNTGVMFTTSYKYEVVDERTVIDWDNRCGAVDGRVAPAM